LPVTHVRTWYAGGTVQGAKTGVPGTPDTFASGNPAVSTHQTSVVSQRPYGGGQNNDPYSQFGSPRPLQQGQESAVRAPGNAPVGYSNDRLVTYDRHGMFKVGYENSGRKSGYTDPPMDGPARPSLWLVQRTLNYQQGTDTTGATDDLTRDYARNAEGMYVGEQGTGWGPVYGGTPGLYQAYGSYAGISPDTPGYHVASCPGRARGRASFAVEWTPAWVALSDAPDLFADARPVHDYPADGASPR
jgi:hypothetical protein